MDELFIVEPTPAELELRKLRAVQVLVDGVIGQVIFHWKEKERKEREEAEKAKGPAPEDPTLLDTLREHIQGPLRLDLEQAQVLYAKENPEKQPFKSKYEARELFHKHEQWFKDWLAKHGVAEGKHQYGIAEQGRALCHHILGVNYIDCEELATGNEFLDRSHDVLCEFPRTYFSQLIQMDNHLGILWSKRGEFRKAKRHLDEAEMLFNKYNTFRQDTYDPRNPLTSILTYMDSDLDVAYTHTLFYLAQVYGALGNNTKSAWYCHFTLSRQMSTAKYDPLEWAENTADLSNYYVSMKDYEMAFTCLHSAKTIMPSDSDELSKAKLAATFTEFYVDMLRYSAEATAMKITGRPVEALPKLNRELTFHGLTVPPAPSVAYTFEEARDLFKSGAAWVKSALEYYVLDGHVTDHVKLQQAYSNLYRYLSLFETDRVRKSAMMKRRVGILAPLVEAIHPHHYYGVWKQLSYELAETYSGLADMWSEARHQDPTICSLRKINDFIEKSVDMWQRFIRSFERNGELPETIDGDYVQSFLHAHFFAGRLLAKLIAPDTAGTISNLKKSFASFKFFVDYSKKINAQGLNDEIIVAQEMLQLLPHKIQAVESGRLAHNKE